MAFRHFCGSSPVLWTLTVTIHNLHLPVHLNEQFLCQCSGSHLGERLCRTEHPASTSLGAQQRTWLTVSRQTPNSGVYCWGSSKCLMTLGRKRSFHGVQLERALVAAATGRLNITAAAGCSEQGGLGAACCPRDPLYSAAAAALGWKRLEVFPWVPVHPSVHASWFYRGVLLILEMLNPHRVLSSFILCYVLWWRLLQHECGESTAFIASRFHSFSVHVIFLFALWEDKSRS